jgi:penicillin amidase
MLYRLVRGALAIVGVLAIVAGLFGVYLFYPSMPTYSGRARLEGLSSEARVWRDSHGVPHIFAANWDDAARALGYIHASERLYQMEIQRRAGQGRLSEVVGPDLVGVDRFVRALGLYRLADSSLSSLSPDTRERLQAYADGVNAFLTSHADMLSPEFFILGDKPEPWTPADSVVIGKLLSLQLSHNYKIELMRAEIARKFPPEQASWIFPDLPDDSPVTTAPEAATRHSKVEPDVELGRWLPWGHGASNEWAVAGSRTTTGKPILANDPHLALGAPILWFLARIVTPEGFVKGATIPGQPVVLLGQNDKIAWGFTNAGTDTQDLFIETLDPADPSRYLTPEGPRPFETRDEVIHVKGAPDVRMTVRATRHGPVLSDVSAEMAEVAGPGKVMALAFTGLDGDDTTSEAVMRLDVARDWNQFLAAVKLFVTPTQNIVYADVSGDIGFISPGRVPLRKSGDGLAPTDGASGATDWTGIVPFEQLPRTLNPEAGFLFNANNAIVSKDRQATFGRDWEESFRARRIRQFMDTVDKHSIATSAMMQADRVSLAALTMKPILATITPSDERERQALQLIAGWNGEADKDRPEPLIFNAFLRALHRILLVDKLGMNLDDLGPFDATTLISLITQHPTWCDAPDKPDPGCEAALRRALDEALLLIVARDGPDMSKWKWGDEHIAVLTHKLYSHVPLLDRLSDLSVRSGGDFYTLDRGGGFDAPKDQPFARTHGAGYRGIYDLSDPDKSRFMITTGESGLLLSPHYGDLVSLWLDVKSIPLAGSEMDLKKSGAKELVFSPE